MFPVFRSLSLRYLRQRWERALLVVFSISLGVATLVSTLILNQCLEDAAHDTQTPIPVADLYISNGEIGVRCALADEIKKANIPGVEAVIPVVFEQVHLSDLGDQAGRIAILFAADVRALSGLKDDGKKPFDVVLLDFRNALDGIFVSEPIFEELRAAGLEGKPVKVRFGQTEVQYPLAGYLKVKDDGKAAAFQRNLLAMNLGAAFALLDPPHPVAASAAVVGPAVVIGGDSTERAGRIDVHLSKAADIDAVRQQIRHIVGARASVKDVEEQKKSTDDAIAGIKVTFYFCSAGALIVGLFLVYNALSVSVAERHHDIGVLRCLGATRTQIARLFAGEAALLGIGGALLGIPLGSFLANTAFEMVKGEADSMFLNPDVQPTKLSLYTLAAAFAAGLATALLAALVPAVQAANDEPADAVRRVPGASNRIFVLLHHGLCLLLIAGGTALILFRQSLAPHSGSYVGMAAVLVGMLLALPTLVAWIARLFQPLTRACLGMEARLAADNLIRSPARTGVVIGAMAAGVGLMFQTAGVGISNEVPIKQWIDQVIQADAFVFAGSITSANSSLSPMAPNVGETMKKVEGVEHVVGLRFVRPDFRDNMIVMVGIDAGDYFRGTQARLPHSPRGLETFQRLPSGNYIVVSDNFAARFKMKEGDVVTLPSRTGTPVDLTIIGIGQDYTWNKGTIFMDRKRYVEMFDDPPVDIYHVYFKEGADKKAVRTALEAAVASSKLVVEDRGFVHQMLAGVIDKIYRLAYLQQLIVAVVVALGVITALLISVLQRRRELGLLRAVGATQPQVIKTVLAEAFLMGIIGTLLGIALGLPLEWYLLKVVIFEESGFQFEMIIPWFQALGIAAVAIGVATLAGLLPALHAVRLRIVDAIAYE